MHRSVTKQSTGTLTVSAVQWHMCRLAVQIRGLSLMRQTLSERFLLGGNAYTSSCSGA